MVGILSFLSSLRAHCLMLEGCSADDCGILCSPIWQEIFHFSHCDILGFPIWQEIFHFSHFNKHSIAFRNYTNIPYFTYQMDGNSKVWYHTWQKGSRETGILTCSCRGHGSSSSLIPLFCPTHLFHQAVLECILCNNKKAVMVRKYFPEFCEVL